MTATAADYEAAHQELAEAEADAWRAGIRTWPADERERVVVMERPNSEQEEL